MTICPHCRKSFNVKQLTCVICKNTIEQKWRYEVYENVRGHKRIRGHICDLCYKELIGEKENGY